MMYGKTALSIPAVSQLQTDDNAQAPMPKRFGELMKCLDIVPGISKTPQWTTEPGHRYIRLGFVKPQWKTSIPSSQQAITPESSPLLTEKAVEPVSCAPYI
jgi:hypothetical protein